MLTRKKTLWHDRMLLGTEVSVAALNHHEEVPMSNGATETLARWINETTYEQIPPAAIEQVHLDGY